MSDIAIKIENLKKRYRLGEIGGTTLTAELQNWWARRRGKENPNAVVGTDFSKAGQTFHALNGIDLEVKKGEALGVIGANGAGKSTLLKILSRVTAPTEGAFGVNGRIASMLEVGTGFSPYLTGRENIYMNGAILGMTKKEVDGKIESIIDFSECRQFIDTPVKRYSSGMYVKLAFAVASHLDAEIMIMDEVLAVGDMKFQKKCLGKMGDEAHGGKTVLYVSHNMATIRNLCSRCIVLDKGKVIFDGDVESAIAVYMNSCKGNLSNYYDFSLFKRHSPFLGIICKINSVSFLGRQTPRFSNNEKIEVLIEWEVFQAVKNIELTMNVEFIDGTPIGFADIRKSLSDYSVGSKKTRLLIDFSKLAGGIYSMVFHLTRVNVDASVNDLDEVGKTYVELIDGKKSIQWQRQYWGSLHIDITEVITF